ncbi:hypothetical protein [Hymenobacter cavernae]|uniref:XRE family transcriptional regulator n=1 Tax=Hymenobacter cavernae TaxID=2044852 RepID=A0ABQ1UW31_9BACT|nr:hypothetical protein [Hymenobacter cavernae]GGF27243.1 hypothetical protein GCM10011383_43620 [Hymenobacter cavernae]
MNSKQIGKRLALLRDELASPGEEKWAQSKVAAETGLTLNQVARLEQAAAGSIEGFVTILLFYHNKGYNISWILLPDNTTVSKRALSENTKTVDARDVIKKLSAFKEEIGKEVDTLMEVLTE